jgi:hypothetical protein
MAYNLNVLNDYEPPHSTGARAIHQQNVYPPARQRNVNGELELS